MSALRALKLARAAGVDVNVDGDTLALNAAAEPPTKVLELLVRHKAQLIFLLRPGRDGWSGEDWQAFFDERAGIVESDGGFERKAAELIAFEDCVERWLLINPPQIATTLNCLQCGKAIDPEAKAVVAVAGTKGNSGFVHGECGPKWRNLRRWEARRHLGWLLEVFEGVQA